MIRALAALLLALLAPALAHAQTFPKFTGLVVDAANVLPAERKAALEAKLAAFQQQTKRQLVVATIPDLQGYPIEDYGYKLGRAWGVGLQNVDNGVVLFVAPNEPAGHRGPRIEVGYRLESVLTDALSRAIIDNKMIPLLKGSNDVAGALDAGADAIMAQLSLPDEEAKGRVAAAEAEFNRTHRRSDLGGAGVPLGIVFWVLVVGFIFLNHRRRAARQWGGHRYTSGSGSNWPIWLWAASEIANSAHRDREGGGSWGGFGDGGGGGSDGSWGGGGFTGGGGGSFGGGGASGDW